MYKAALWPSTVRFKIVVGDTSNWWWLAERFLTPTLSYIWTPTVLFGSVISYSAKVEDAVVSTLFSSGNGSSGNSGSSVTFLKFQNTCTYFRNKGYRNFMTEADLLHCITKFRLLKVTGDKRLQISPAATASWLDSGQQESLSDGESRGWSPTVVFFWQNQERWANITTSEHRLPQLTSSDTDTVPAS